jgi:hypothetical protein
MVKLVILDPEFLKTFFLNAVPRKKNTIKRGRNSSSFKCIVCCVVALN